MARRRVIDWKKVRNFLAKRRVRLKRRQQRLGWPVKLTWFAILATADDYGMGDWSPADIAMTFMAEELDIHEITVAEVAEIMVTFTKGPDPSVVVWEHEGRPYFALPKSQDYQRVHSPANADCPCPPPQILAKLSPKTQRHIRESLAKFTSVPEGVFRLEEEEEGEEEGEEEITPRSKAGDVPSPRSRKSKGQKEATCSFCAEPREVEDESVAPVHRLLQDYHDAYRAEHSKCPTLSTKDCAGAGAVFKRLLKAGHGIAEIRAVIRHGLQSEDNLMVNSGWSILQIGRQFDGIARALERGELHGTRGRSGRRASPSPSEEHGGGGEVDL